ncbi:hypothetical protein RAS1_35750 [Phycisphaerae bacterium RAS1]|nr:hypothetical protein RAS1_35750 [Phycisphaerae bacterium RAS1]
MRMPCLSTIFVCLTLAAVAAAGEQSFDFKDPKGVNAMYFLLDSQVEPIMGLAAGISGKIKFDAAAPAKASGSIVVAAKSLQTQNKGMNEKLHSPEWLDVETQPEITFAFKSVKDVKKVSETATEMMVVGDFTCRGVTKELTIPVRADYLAGGLKNRMGKEGDLLVLRTSFSIKRGDFEIKKDMLGSPVVADEIQIRAHVTGTCAK